MKTNHTIKLSNSGSKCGTIEKSNTAADILNNQALSYLDLGEAGEAEKCWKEALKQTPTVRFANTITGFICGKMPL